VVSSRSVPGNSALVLGYTEYVDNWFPYRLPLIYPINFLYVHTYCFATTQLHNIHPEIGNLKHFSYSESIQRANQNLALTRSYIVSIYVAFVNFILPGAISDAQAC
jgi:hypothetical protein